MAGIVGVACSGKRTAVNEMLEVIKHRGGRSEVIVEHSSATLGQTTARPYKMWLGRTPNCLAVCDGAILNWRNLSPERLDVDAAIENLYTKHGPAFLRELVGPFALAIATEDGVFLARDCLGASPLICRNKPRGALFCFRDKGCCQTMRSNQGISARYILAS
ncbi:MAG: hypothetical protein ACUVRS_04410 [Armatimonadota bacterium]